MSRFTVIWGMRMFLNFHCVWFAFVLRCYKLGPVIYKLTYIFKLSD